MATKLDAILSSTGLSNHDLVEAYGHGLSHKTVQKARSGSRPLTRRMQDQVVEALNRALGPDAGQPYKRADLLQNDGD